MEIENLKIGVLAMGEFRRLAPHHGAIDELYRLLGHIDCIVGGSAGALKGTAMSPGTPENSSRVQGVIRNLKSSNIFTVPMESKVSAVLALGALSFPLLNHLEPQMRRVSRIALHMVQTAFGIGLGVWLVRRMYDAPSVLDNSPLGRLLETTLDFEAIRTSATEVRIMATDIETGEHVMFSTREPGLTKQRLIEILLASATIPIQFPIRSLDGRLLTDAEVKTNFPIDQLQDMDIVLVLCYSEGIGQHKMPRTLGEHFSGMWDVVKAENLRYARKDYEQRRRENPSLPEAVFIMTDRRIPALTLDDFNQPALERSMELGQQIIAENVEHIGQALGRALARKERG